MGIALQRTSSAVPSLERLAIWVLSRLRVTQGLVGSVGCAITHITHIHTPGMTASSSVLDTLQAHKYTCMKTWGGLCACPNRLCCAQAVHDPNARGRFLSQGAGTAKAISRKPVNFYSHFATLHADEEAARKRMLQDTRAKTKQDMGAANQYVAPTTKRRDELRWQTRMKLLNTE